MAFSEVGVYSLAAGNEAEIAMSVWNELNAIKQRMESDYNDYMQSFVAMREEFNRRMNEQQQALARYQKGTREAIELLEKAIVSLDERVSKLETKQ